MKQKLLTKYAAACKLRFNQSPADWQAVFPTAESLAVFWKETKGLSFPENYGQAPFDDAGSIAFWLVDGIGERSLAYYRGKIEIANPCPYDLGKITIAASYGQPEAIALLTELNYMIQD